MSEPQRVSIGFKELPFELETSPDVTVYAVMRELSGKYRNAYLDFVEKVVERGSDGKPKSMKTWKGSQTRLLSMCLYRAKLDATGRPVTTADGAWVADVLFKEEELENWPDPALQFLSDAGMSLSQLNETEGEAKNV